ncbi:MAG: phage tail sheath subtilisin-like domain-containing protein [Acidobacteriota bacterium]
MTYQSPGVYVEEIPSSVRPIAGVSTSTAGFIGVVPSTISLIAKNTSGTQSNWKYVNFPLPKEIEAGKPVLITSWSQFTKNFGDLIGDPGEAAVTAPAPEIDQYRLYLAHAVYGFFHNGGSRCYVTRLEAVDDIDEGIDKALLAFETIDEIAIVAAPGHTSANVYDKIVTHCKKMQDRFAILDGPTTAGISELTKPIAEGGFMPPSTDFAAWYFPWIQVFDPGTKLKSTNSDDRLAIPPSGHIAGVYARVDNERGVHKAPANEVIQGALGVAQPISKNDQNGLNPDGVNCIRSLNNNILIWGARTIGGDENGDLMYINVRRTLLFLRESIEEGTQWVVFEPNTPALWQKITRNITAFLTNVWRSGALFGNTPQEAFYVKCDKETNPPEVRDIGQVVTEIGVAIARPAEFVIFRISQMSSTSK